MAMNLITSGAFAPSCSPAALFSLLSSIIFRQNEYIKEKQYGDLF